MAISKRVIERTHQLDMDVCQCDRMVKKIRNDDIYAQNFYAALCNQEWREEDVWEILQDKTWSCSWRSAGGIVADIRGEGDYMDWYCSGSLGNPDNHGHVPRQYASEGTITDEIRRDLARIGWHPINSVDK